MWFSVGGAQHPRWGCKLPPIDGEWIRAELAAIRKDSTAATKGRRLEALVRRIFCQIPGLSLEDQDVISAYKTQEMDLYFFNAHERDGLHFLDCPLIIECKGWSDPVDGQEIRRFATLLKDKGCRDGIFVALNGITGHPQTMSAGFYHVAAALLGGQLVLVVTGDDLANASNTAGLITLLRRRMLDQVKGQVLAIAGSIQTGNKPRSSNSRPTKRRETAGNG
jgi:hypothetical protein